MPIYLRGDIFGWFNADGRVPLSRWKDRDLVKELIYPSQQVTPVLCLVGYIMEDLVQRGVKESGHLIASGVNLLCSCLELDLKGHSYFICHDGCHGASNFMILLCLSIWAQKNEKEPDFCQEVS